MSHRLIPRRAVLDPSFWEDPVLSRLSAESCLAALALLCHADSEGYFPADPEWVRSRCFPLRRTELSVSEILSELVRSGWLRIESTEVGLVGWIPSYSQTQRVRGSSRLRPLFEESRRRRRRPLPSDLLAAPETRRAIAKAVACDEKRNSEPQSVDACPNRDNTPIENPSTGIDSNSGLETVIGVSSKYEYMLSTIERSKLKARGNRKRG